MKSLNLIIKSFLILTFLGLGSFLCYKTALASNTDEAFIQIFEKYKSGVFAVKIKIRTFGGVTTGSGTGFIYSATPIENNQYRYEMLTNAHNVSSIIQSVVENTTDEVYRIDLVTYDAKKTYTNVSLLAADPLVDLAILSFTSNEIYPVLPISKRSEFKFLEPILIVGNTRGDAVTPNRGNIKNPKVGMSTYDFITFQHDAEATSGNSGSPLFDEKGEVIGVHFRSNKESLLRYSFNADRILKSIENMKSSTADKGVRYGHWGLAVEPIEKFNRQILAPQIDIHSGLLVNFITPKSSADLAGIKMHDILLSINGDEAVTDVVTSQELYRFTTLIRDSRTGENYKIKLYRPSTKETLELNLIPHEMLFKAPQIFTTRDGFKVMDISELSRELQGFSSDLKGVLIQVPRENSHDFYQNCLITHVNGEAIDSVNTFVAVWKKFEAEPHVVISFIHPQFNSPYYLHGGLYAESDYVLLR